MYIVWVLNLFSSKWNVLVVFSYYENSPGDQAEGRLYLKSLGTKIIILCPVWCSVSKWSNMVYTATLVIEHLHVACVTEGLHLKFYLIFKFFSVYRHMWQVVDCRRQNRSWISGISSGPQVRHSFHSILLRFEMNVSALPFWFLGFKNKISIKLWLKIF